MPLPTNEWSDDMTDVQPPRPRPIRRLLAVVVGSRSAALPADCGLLAARIVLAWIFIYYGAGKLFGAFNGPGIHRTAIYFSETAHLHPSGLFAVIGGVIEFGRCRSPWDWDRVSLGPCQWVTWSWR